MERDFLSNVELYFSENISEKSGKIYITGNEARHIIRVMRHDEGDEIFITAGKGKIYRTKITGLGKDEIVSEIIEEKEYENNLENVSLCIPILKNFDRLEFALEKSVELGITNFIIYRAKRSGPKNPKLERWQKILTAAMKQSLRSYLPKISFVEDISELKDENIIVFDQKYEEAFTSWIARRNTLTEKTFFVFGPEGGLTEEEITGFSNLTTLKLTSNRLRSETAIITFSVAISLLQR
ncbi:MAG: 16S rRNA (uracil(1498)-N(3))-methyltransferase [Chlorobi bacterium]|nr:16S rRNA (uracil(1498)-N(3))-methyltransferase [Chlorobiota bacterium]